MTGTATLRLPGRHLLALPLTAAEILEIGQLPLYSLETRGRRTGGHPLTGVSAVRSAVRPASPMCPLLIFLHLGQGPAFSQGIQ